jgi:hypothetical protein
MPGEGVGIQAQARCTGLHEEGNALRGKAFREPGHAWSGGNPTGTHTDPTRKQPSIGSNNPRQEIIVGDVAAAAVLFVLERSCRTRGAFLVSGSVTYADELRLAYAAMAGALGNITEACHPSQLRDFEVARKIGR